MATQRCVVIGDVIGSRDVKDRGALSDRLDDGIRRANGELADRLVAPFATLKGVDEIGGVLSDLDGSYRAVRLLTEAIHPTEIRFAVVRGAVDVGSATGDVAEMDGPAFHEADDAVSRLREGGRYLALSVNGAKAWLVDLVANQMNLLTMWKYTWTGRQAEVVRTYRDAATMAATAERLGVSVQSISKTLKRAHVEAIFDVETDLETALGQLAGVDA